MVFISLVQLVALWFPPARTAMVTQMTGVVGQIGAVVATAPLSAALHGVGWTKSFAGAASVGVLLGVVLIVVVRDSPYRDHHRDELKMRAVGRALPCSRRGVGALLKQDARQVVLLGRHLGGRLHLDQTCVGRLQPTFDNSDLSGFVPGSGLGFPDLTR
jgi:hypothetical protein